LTVSLLGTQVGFEALFDPARRFPVIGFVLASAAWIVLGLFISAIVRQSNERRMALEELQATRDELSRAERQAGVLQERQRLAGEIHDTLAQGLASIVMQLEAAEQTWEEDPALGRQHVQRARDSARQNLEEARRVVWALQPQALEHEPLGQALTQTVERWSQDNGIAATTSVTGAARDLLPGIEATLLRASQEALANVAKHARASHVNVTLSYLSDQVILDVQDNGCGFDPQPWLDAQVSSNGHDAVPPAGGFGLATMRDRARQLGGALEVDSQSGTGTTVTVLLPLRVPREVAP
jgi:signal transduction histidine kinase